MDALPFADLEQTGRYYEGIFPGLFVGDCYVEYPNPDLYPAYSGHGAPLPADDGYQLIKYVNAKGYESRVWASLGKNGFNGTTPVTNEATMNLWAPYWADVHETYDAGYDVINTYGVVISKYPALLANILTPGTSLNASA